MTHTDTQSSASQQLADAELVRRVAMGDRDAARLVARTHLSPIVRFAFRMLGDAAEAEDVAQETFLRFWRAAERWEPRAKLSTWMHRVAHNLCIDRIRARRGSSLQQENEQEDPADGARDKLERYEAERSVAAALADLPDRQRAAIALVYYEGMGNQQAAEVMGVHVDAMESLLARGRRNLRKRLADGVR